MRLGAFIRWIFHQLGTYGRAIPHRLHSQPKGYAFLAFLFIYLALVRYCSYAYYRDPTSAFFDPVRGYERKYSLQRQHEAEAFIKRANSTAFPQNKPKNLKKMCVGIATVARDEEQYIGSTIGSLVDGLTPNEREEIYLMVLIAHNAPQDHPSYGQLWLTNIADKVLIYDVDQDKEYDLALWEKENDYRSKAIFDYSYMLQKCLDTGAPWVLMLEDDTLAVNGWYPRTNEALAEADVQHPVSDESDWLYMRLFFTEEFLGWNAEEWPQYLAASIGVTGMAAMILVLIRQFALEKAITNAVIAGFCLLCIPACILLYFMAGRLSMQHLQPGVYKMPKFGCCAQSFVFSHRMAEKVITRLTQKGQGFVDEIIEAWANEADLVRFVTIPSLFQHIGGHSSKGDDFGGKAKYDRSVAEKIWNFGFELFEDKQHGTPFAQS